MSADPLRRVGPDSAAVHKLLRDARIDDHAEKAFLAELLDAATAPARESELTGEQSALAAFRQAHQAAAAESAGRAGVDAPSGRAPANASAATTDALRGTADSAVPTDPRATRTAPVTSPVGGGLADGPCFSTGPDRAAGGIPSPQSTPSPPLGLLRSRFTALRARMPRVIAVGVVTAAAGSVAAIAFASGGGLPGPFGGESGARTDRTASSADGPPSPMAGGSRSPGFGIDSTTSPGTPPGDGGPDPTDSSWHSAGPSGSPGDAGERHRRPGTSGSGPNPPLVTPGTERDSKALRRLCRKYLREERLNGKQLKKLAYAAGGAKHIREYCTGVVEKRPGGADKDGDGQGRDKRRRDGHHRSGRDHANRSWSENRESAGTRHAGDSARSSRSGREVASLPPRLPPSARYSTAHRPPA